MIVIACRQAKAPLRAFGRRTKNGDRALITRRGKPFLLVVGVDGEELLDVLIRWDPGFWADLERRRARSRKSSVSLDDFEAQLARPQRKRAKRNGRRR